MPRHIETDASEFIDTAHKTQGAHDILRRQPPVPIWIQKITGTDQDMTFCGCVGQSGGVTGTRGRLGKNQPTTAGYAGPLRLTWNHHRAGMFEQHRFLQSFQSAGAKEKFRR